MSVHSTIRWSVVPRAASVSPKASRSSVIVCRVVGTSRRRSTSLAACTDQASRAGNGLSARIVLGEVPTVETHTCRLKRPKPRGFTRALSASETPPRLSPGSPIPIKTTLRTGGKPHSRATRTAACTCSRISSAESERSRPMVPVAQKAHARPHPTCDETHSVEKARALAAGAPCGCRSCGMSTASMA
eukprot:scaffold207704_cov33-Tisochrysis_lutea.AAC.3